MCGDLLSTEGYVDRDYYICYLCSASCWGSCLLEEDDPAVYLGIGFDQSWELCRRSSFLSSISSYCSCRHSPVNRLSLLHQHV